MDTRQNRIYLSPPHLSGYEYEMVQEVFESNWIAPLGPQVDRFENEIAHYAGVAGGVALSSGTAAIHLGLKLLGVGPSDIVFCSSLTFIGTVNPVLYLGGQPVFIDSEPTSWNMSPAALKVAFKEAERSGRLPKAVIIVNLYGQNADMLPLLDICNSYGVPVLEDAAESLGATYQGRPSGSWGKFGIFSFNGNKIITTSGGGMLVSDDIEALEKARFWATQARDPFPWYEHSEIGYNYRMSNVLASIGRAQLRVLDDRVQTRRSIFAYYRERLQSINGITFMPEAKFGRCNRWLTVIRIDPNLEIEPGQLIAAMESENIECRRIWKPMHLQPVFAANAYYTDGLNSVADDLFEYGLCLPSGSSLTRREQDRVIQCLLHILLKP